MTPRLLGLGTAVPGHRFSQQDLLTINTLAAADRPRYCRILKRVYQEAKVAHRHVVLQVEEITKLLQRGVKKDDATTELYVASSTGDRMMAYHRWAPGLAEQAARQALEQSGIPARQVTHLVTVSCTGFHSPGVDCHLQSTLGLPPTVERVHVGFMGCHGAINGLRVARGLAAADPNAVVLLAAVELCSLHFSFEETFEGMVGNALFADGAAAAVLSAAPTKTDSPWSLQATGSCMLPKSRDQMAWAIRDQGFRFNLSSEIPQTIVRHLREWMEQWLDRQNLALADVAHWIVHPGGPKIIDAVDTALELPASATDSARYVLQNFGNMSSPTVFFVMNHIEATKPDGWCVMLGFGPGLAAEAALWHRS